MSLDDLASRECVPCAPDTRPLAQSRYQPLLERLSGWEVIDHHHLTRTFEFEDFVQALAFVNRVGAIADAQSHHPDIYLAWGKVRVEIWTHTIDGLSEADFILAAKIDRLGLA